MPTYVYVAAQDDNKISIFTMDGESGALTLQGEQAVAGGPSLLAISRTSPCSTWDTGVRPRFPAMPSTKAPAG